MYLNLHPETQELSYCHSMIIEEIKETNMIKVLVIDSALLSISNTIIYIDTYILIQVGYHYRMT